MATGNSSNTTWTVCLGYFIFQQKLFWFGLTFKFPLPKILKMYVFDMKSIAAQQQKV